MYRVAIDLQPLQTKYSGNRGVGRYLKNLISGLVKLNDTNFEFEFFLNGFFKESSFEIKKQLSSVFDENKIHIWFQNLRFDTLIGNEYEWQKCKACEYIRDWYISQFEPDVIFSANLQEGFDGAVTAVNTFETDKIYFTSTIHDFSPFLLPEVGGLNNKKVLVGYLDKIRNLNKCNFIFTVSNFTKQKALDYLKFDEDKIGVEYNSVNLKKFIFNKECIDFKSKKNFIFYLGPLESYKNINIVLEGYKLLPNKVRQNYKLYLAGFNPENLDLKKYGLDNTEVCLLGKISDEEYVSLLQKCKFFIFPSKCEGFGLPLLEAMACGALALSSSATSMPEFVASDKVLFNPNNAQQLSNLIQYFLKNENEANKIIQQSIEKVKLFKDIDQAYSFLSYLKKNVQINNECKKIPEKLLYQKIRELKTLTIDDRMILAKDINKNLVCLN